MPKQGEKKAKTSRKSPSTREVTVNLHKRLHGQYVSENMASIIPKDFLIF